MDTAPHPTDSALEPGPDRRPWIDSALSVIDRKHPKRVRCRPQSSGANSAALPGFAAAPLSGKRLSFAAGGRDANRQRREWIDPPRKNRATDPLGFACCESVDERLAHRETRCVSALPRIYRQFASPRRSLRA